MLTRSTLSLSRATSRQVTFPRHRNFSFSSSSLARTSPKRTTQARPSTQEESEELNETLPEDIISQKIQTIPFQITPEKALQISETAAASTFGLSIVFAHLVSRFVQKWFAGWKPAALDSGIERIAWKMVLLPVWKVDLAMKGKALLEDAQLDLSISALNASLPGFRLSPLDELSISAPFSTDPVPYSPSQHLTQHSEPVTVLPFTHHPLNLLSKISKLPRTISSQDGIGINPKELKTTLFATYPLFVPVYLGEFGWSDGFEEKRCTTVQFGTVDSPAFSVYPQFITPPQWLPQSDSISLSISGRPSSQDDLPRPGALKELEPRLTALLSKVQNYRKLSGRTREEESGGRDGEGEEEGMITDKIKKDETLKGLVEGNQHVLAYSEWVEGNQEFLEAHQKLDNMTAMLDQVEAMPDNVKSLLISSRGPKLQDRESLLKDVRKNWDEARKVVEEKKPEWIKKL